MPLWQEVLVGIAMSHVETLECSSVIRDHASVCTTLARALHEMVASQPWHFRWGIKMYAAGLGVLPWMRFLPLYGLIETFAQSAAFLNVFDDPALAERLPSSPICPPKFS